jgi:hypothetical protein
MEMFGNGPHLIQRALRKAADTVQRLPYSRGRRGEFVGDQFKLSADSSQSLSDAGVKLPSETTPLQLHLADCLSTPAATLGPRKDVKAAFRHHQAEEVADESDLYGDQPIHVLILLNRLDRKHNAFLALPYLPHTCRWRPADDLFEISWLS